MSGREIGGAEAGSWEAGSVDSGGFAAGSGEAGGLAGAGIDPRLLDLLVCPVTRGALTYDRERQELVSRGAQLAFPIHDGIPVMLVSEARPLE